MLKSPIGTIKQEKQSTLVKVKREKQSPESSSTESSSDDSDDEQMHLNRIKRELNTEKQSKRTFIPRPIKMEPQSDVEGINPENKRNRKRKSSINEHIDSLVDSILNKSNPEKKKRSKTSGNESTVSNLETSHHSTLKIKQETNIEEESSARKKAKKSSTKSKSLKSMEKDLFESFL